MKELDSTSGKTRTLWLETQTQPHFETLPGNLSCDVVVVGAGITGLSVAYNALKQGLSVIVLEDGQIGSGETGRTSAHLSNALDDRYYNLEQDHGREGARLAAESHGAAIDWIEAVCEKESIACDFERVTGYLFSAQKEGLSELQKEFEAAKRAGLAVTWADQAPAASIGKCLAFARQAQFHPAKYLAGLAQAIVKAGGKIFTHTHVMKATGGENAVVETKNGKRVQAKHIVIATNSPINEQLPIHTKQAAYRSYVIAAAIPAGSIPHALYWDTADPYHYVRVAPSATPGEELLIVGGEDHKTGQADPQQMPYANLEQWARLCFPQTGQVVYEWSGQVLEPNDGLAFIGHSPLDPPNVYLCTGDSGNGLTHGTIAGLLLVDLIRGKENPWSKLYEPSRKMTSAVTEFVKENANTAAQYLDWLTPGDKTLVENMPRESGIIVRKGFKKMAVYCDKQGELCALSAVCPHLQALVVWNPEEKTWDCPAHGSRFAPRGEVVNGPAVSNLERLEKASLSS